ncbi:LEAF RUST 10 DISEASE-RESISTANCE LOCUS RECEPTOR-LIKE PROTEIN KINASE-like 1.2 isoform X1 [Juglans microcarpa x Juglans regia]|uniref:LEAF RUST 10 DISEASE-RESISTANCE LOCUS RECEPTOR-LIKE PROTEIN KINASE-like 1.2 isoform X1 n=1 Tax=Juglans microcarpa x Juglans regia TaxID=2249226 RepID=UPI001B7EC5F8|nr:LEAF RUST 10 DISEASE-RESISTANCE LOCUS RECEPTOR-LIKE PROTEIN KINASE-like 1.2 isoform X1 [Juglans microcarpa x Juglans regia]
MDTHLSLSSLLITLSFFSTVTPPSHGIEDDPFLACSRPYQCGNLTNIYFPFWGGARPQYCGYRGYELECRNDSYAVMKFEELEFRVLNINQSALSMSIVRMDLWDIQYSCPRKFVNTALNYTLFYYDPQTVQNLTLVYNCSSQVNTSEEKRFMCGSEGGDRYNYTYYLGESNHTEVAKCRSNIKVPILGRGSAALSGQDPQERGNQTLQRVLNEGFEVRYRFPMSFVCGECGKSGGICGSNSTAPFVCFCRGELNSVIMCPRADQKKDWGLKAGIGAGTAAVTVVIMCIIFCIYQQHKKKKYVSSSLRSPNTSSYPSSTVDSEMVSTYFGVHLFSYTELEEATNNFDSDKELGDGGFGTVYYGKLRDGRAVAVKRLYENNWKRAEQFMNEVVILTRLHHQNLVSLYGCTSHRSRELMLVYEYIPNGTVADHLHGECAKPGALPWSTRMNIAIETASALVYLHASDIIHRDVKTNNILLDNNFCVKVADFGLSRLFPTHATHVSTAPQGTPGYVDPEYNECYRLTDKSDVFSFGVVLIELISSMPAVDITRHREEINLSNMAINKIQNHTLHEIVDPSLGFESDYSVRRMILAVAELAFQCLQHAKEMRPSMAKLLETLKEIQNKDCSKHDKVENQLDISADDEIVLLKRQHSLPVSPDSALNWISTSSGSTRST